MADWPRAIQPEDRIKYLLNARMELGPLEWVSAVDGDLVAMSRRNERVWIIRQGDIFEAYYATDQNPEHLVGEFDLLPEAQKALTDYLVVTNAVAQAWEDVAT